MSYLLSNELEKHINTVIDPMWIYVHVKHSPILYIENATGLFLSQRSLQSCFLSYTYWIRELETLLANSGEENRGRGVGTRRTHKRELCFLRTSGCQGSFLLSHTQVCRCLRKDFPLTELLGDSDGGAVVAAQPSLSSVQDSIQQRSAGARMRTTGSCS